MAVIIHVWLLLLTFCSLTSGLLRSKRDTCTSLTQRKSWQNLTDTEKLGYINATLCLIDAPPKSGIPGAKSRWDELQYVHIVQSDYIHFTGSFLPWHRYFLTVHETLLREECGYQGAMPYWNEVLDVANLTNSPVFDPTTGFGGNGVSPYFCVGDGPLVNVTLHYNQDMTTTNYCLIRFLNECPFQGAAQSVLDSCLAEETFEDVWHCIEASPHIAGHAGVGGVMVNLKLSPGDPLFYLHHTWLDRLWWLWQSQDPDTRLTEIGGPNIPASTLPPFLSGPNPSLPPLAAACLGNATAGATPAQGADVVALPAGHSLAEVSPDAGSPSAPAPFPALTDYFNDGGNVTTLNHTLWSVNVFPNATIGDVMDLHSPLVCADYE